MNANAQQNSETSRNWGQQWTDAALGAVKAHEQFVTNMVGAFNKPVGLDTVPPQAREAMSKCMDFATRQTLEGEKFVTNLVRDGIEHGREFFNTQPEMTVPLDGEKTRQATDRFMQESVKTTADVINREMAFVNERLNDVADFGRSMINCGCTAAGNAANDIADNNRKRAAAKA